jgi:hypothetical protein
MHGEELNVGGENMVLLVFNVLYFAEPFHEYIKSAFSRSVPRLWDTAQIVRIASDIPSPSGGVAAYVVVADIETSLTLLV